VKEARNRKGAKTVGEPGGEPEASETAWGMEGVPRQLCSAQRVVQAARLVQQGKIYDLGRLRFPGMPVPAMHPPFQIVTYRTPSGLRKDTSGIWLGAVTILPRCSRSRNW
jgi:hypothetical protein